MVIFSKQIRILVIVAAVLFIISAVVLSEYVSAREDKLFANIEEQIQNERKQLVIYADYSDRNQIDEIMGAVIKDCSSRAEFENLLVNLNNVSRQSLLRASQLFESCGDYFATKKGVMVVILRREVAALRMLTDLYSSLAEDDKYIGLLNSWANISDAESTRSDLLAEQAMIQKNIIEDLLTGKRGDIPKKIQRAQEIEESLGVQDKQIEVMRKEEEAIWNSTLLN